MSVFSCMINKKWRYIVVSMLSGACLFSLLFLGQKRLELSIGRNLQSEIMALNKCKVDSALSRMKTGYLVLRMGLDADSYLLARMNQKNKRYSHCGIVMVENGYPFVYHSIGGEDNPDERLRRDSANLFFSPRCNSAIAVVAYDFNDGQLSNLKKEVEAYYKKRPRFDMKFDLKTDDVLYCAEFVYKAVNKATGDPSYIGSTSYLGYRYVGIDDLFMNKHAHLLWQSQFK
jgi:hypothetical protein